MLETDLHTPKRLLFRLVPGKMLLSLNAGLSVLETTPNSCEVSQKPDRTLTLKELVGSFQFSQGNPPLQANILRYLKWLRPNTRITAEDRLLLLEAGTHGVERIALDAGRHGSGHITSYMVQQEFERVLDVAARVFNEEERPDSHLIATISVECAKQDHSFLTRLQGRGYTSGGSVHYDPRKDPWRSDVCYFGLLGHTTGIPEYDHMFADIADYWRDQWSNPRAFRGAEMRQVAAIFNEHHPDMQVDNHSSTLADREGLAS